MSDMPKALTVIIRLMKPEDLSAVLALWLSTPGIGLNESDTPERLMAYLQRNPGHSFVATESGTIIGAVLCGNDGRRGSLNHLAVAAKWQRHGIGTALVERCLMALEAQAITKCNIFVYANNQAGQEFWASQGWKTRPDLLLLQKVLAE